jgi:hypothetical protein
MAQTLGDYRISFQCRRCGLFWLRSPLGKRGFAWKSVSEHVAWSPALGVAVPPLSGSASPHPLPFRRWATDPAPGDHRKLDYRH